MCFYNYSEKLMEKAHLIIVQQKQDSLILSKSFDS